MRIAPRKLRYISAVLGMLLGTGGALATPANAQEGPTPQLAVPDNYADANIARCKNSNRANGSDNRSATGMVGLSACWEADPANASYRVLNDLYAHWIIQRIDNNQFAREYRRESLPAPLRLFFGRDRSFVSSIRIDMHDPDLPIVIPLVNFGYQGKVGKGENWSTDIVSDDQSQPYFRVGPSTSATITVSAKSTNNVEVRATAAILDTLKSFSAIVSPGGSLITTLNREPLSKASNAVDSALSSIWSQVRDERQISGRQLSEWYEGAGILIDVEIPSFVKTKANGSNNAAANPDGYTRRVYVLKLSCPRYSIFDPALACANVDAALQPTQPSQDPGYASDAFARGVLPLRKRVSAQQIVNYPLAQGKSLAQFLSDHAWYTQFLRMVDENQTPINTAPTAPPPSDDPAALPPAAAPTSTTGETGKSARARSENDYGSICSQIVDALYGAGLSSFDSRLGLWATVTGSSDFVGISQNFQKVAQCRDLLPLRDRAVWTFTPPEPAPARPAQRKAKRKVR